jgi:hypothetical protein
MSTGRAVTGVLHLCNQTLFDWYSKRQATVETATFGSEFTAATIAVDQIIDLKTTLRLWQTVQYLIHLWTKDIMH